MKYLLLSIALIISYLSIAQNYEKNHQSQADTLWSDSVEYVTTTNGIASKQIAEAHAIAAGPLTIFLTNYEQHFTYHKFMNFGTGEFTLDIKSPKFFTSKTYTVNNKEYKVDQFVIKHCYGNGVGCYHGHKPMVEVIFWNAELGIIQKRLEIISHSITEDTKKQYKIWMDAKPDFLLTTLTRHSGIQQQNLKNLQLQIMNDGEFYLAFLYNPNYKPGYVKIDSFRNKVYADKLLQSRLDAAKVLFD